MVGREVFASMLAKRKKANGKKPRTHTIKYFRSERHIASTRGRGQDSEGRWGRLVSELGETRQRRIRTDYAAEGGDIYGALCTSELKPDCDFAQM